MDCSTIIVSYNTFALTREAVRSALDSGRGIEHEVVIVDNASPDGSGGRLRKEFPAGEFPNVTVVCNDQNLGFSRSNNIGARMARGRILFFLNPDTVVHGDAVPQLAAYLDANERAGAVGPLVLNGDGTIQVSTAQFDTAGKLVRNHFPLLPRRTPSDAEQQVDIINGCALAMRREVFDSVGGWDEDYFMYAEENELCYALTRAGYYNIFLPSAVITHFGGSASLERYAEQQVLAHQSAVAFLRRHAGLGLVRLNRVLGIAGYGIRSVIFPLAARLHRRRADEFRRRGEAAAALWRWFLRSYS